MGKGFTEIEGLFQVGERIFEERDYAVLIGLYGNGQVIYTGEEAGISFWEEAFKEHDDWVVIATEELANNLYGLDDRKIVDNDVFLTISLRADFIDCSKWVEQAIYRSHATVVQGKTELEALHNTEYGLWFAEKCRELEKAYSVYGNQGLELDCPIVVFGGGLSVRTDSG